MRRVPRQNYQYKSTSGYCQCQVGGAEGYQEGHCGFLECQASHLLGQILKTIFLLRYPGREKGEDFSGLFTPLEAGGLSYSQPKHTITERVQECGTNTLQSKLQFVNVKQREKDTSIPDGLGPLPQNISKVGSLTIYNTAESPYSAGLKSDPLEAKMKARKQLDDDVEGEDVDDSALGSGGVVGRDDDMFYNPELGDLPEFDLPDDLMLPNIAQDLTYSQVKAW